MICFSQGDLGSDIYSTIPLGYVYMFFVILSVIIIFLECAIIIGVVYSKPSILKERRSKLNIDGLIALDKVTSVSLNKNKFKLIDNRIYKILPNITNLDLSDSEITKIMVIFSDLV